MKITSIRLWVGAVLLLVGLGAMPARVLGQEATGWGRSDTDEVVTEESGSAADDAQVTDSDQGETTGWGTVQTGDEAGTAGSQEDTDRAMQLWDDLLHYAVIGHWELARGSGEALLAMEPEPLLLFQLAESRRYTDSYSKLSLLQVDSPIQDIATSVLEIVEQGRYQLRKDPERIAEDVRRLSGTTRGRMLAMARLTDSGEWAVPVIINALRDPGRNDEYAVLRWALPRLGRPAVVPLTVVLRECEDVNIRTVALEALGKIGYRDPLPVMQEITQTSGLPVELKTAARAAMRAITREELLPMTPAAVLYTELGEQYYYHAESLELPANQEQGHLWFWDETAGLIQEPVAREAYNELMTMRQCEQALELDPSHTAAVALWLSGFFRFEAEGHPQPGYFGDHHPQAPTYALTAGPQQLHHVLERALADRNRPVALAAIEVLTRNSGQKSLLFELDGHQPLMDAMVFPDRQIRYTAAMAIGGSLPQQSFENSQLVVPVLAEALRQKGQQYALVADPQSNRRNRLMSDLRENGFQDVIGHENFAIALEQAAELPSYDLIVLAYGIEQPGIAEAIEIIRKDYRLAYSPVIIEATLATIASARELQARHPFVAVMLEGTTIEEMLEKRQELLETNHAQPFHSDLAEEYAQRSAEVLHQLAHTDNTILKPTDAETALVETAKETKEPIRTLATQTLAYLSTPQAQRTIATLALDEGLGLETRMMALEALTISAKRNGSMLTAGQIDAMVAIIESPEKDPTIREATAQAYGAMSLPSAQTSRFILNQACSTVPCGNLTAD